MNLKDPEYLKELDKCGLAKINWPLFKFLKKEHAEGLISEGSVRVSRLADFRDSGKYSNQIYDPEEAIFYVENYYESFEGYPEDAYGVLHYAFKHGESINVQNGAFHTKCDFGESLAYCATTGLFNESMIQAFEDEKDSCVLITDPSEFFSIIDTKLNGFSYMSYDECNYCGRIINEKNPTANSYSHFVLKNHAYGILHKPVEFKNQAESRAVWIPKPYAPTESINLKDQRLTSLVKPLHFTGIDLESLKSNTQKQVVIQLQHKTGSDTWISFEEPKEIPTPIILFSKDHPDTPYLGFIFLSHQRGLLYLKNVYYNHKEISHSDTPFSEAFFLNPLENITEIYYHTVQEGTEVCKANPVISLGALSFHFGVNEYKIELTCLYTKGYPRWYGFLKTCHKGNGILIMISKQSNVWKAEPESEIRDMSFIGALAKEIENYYLSKNVSFPI